MPVRTGRVNGLPCVSIYKTVEDRHHPGDKRPPLGPQGGWTAGLPDFWPMRPTEQCLACGFNYRTASDESLGHVCARLDQPDDPDMVAVIEHPIEYRNPNDKLERWP